MEQGIALEQIARRFVKEPDRQKKDRFPVRSVNLLGVTPLDFGPQENVERLKENLKKYGWNVLSTWAMGDDLETLQKAGEATVSLVVSAVGLLAAEVLRETYKIPYVIGTPNQWLAGRYFQCTGDSNHAIRCSNTAVRSCGFLSEEPHAAGSRDHSDR